MGLEEDQKHSRRAEKQNVADSCSTGFISAFRIVEYTNYPCDEGLFVLICLGLKKKLFSLKVLQAYDVIAIVKGDVLCDAIVSSLLGKNIRAGWEA